MTPENEKKREEIKRWFLDNSRSNIDFMRDVMEVRRLNSFPDIERAIEHLYSEMEQLGSFLPQCSCSIDGTPSCQARGTVNCKAENP